MAGVERVFVEAVEKAKDIIRQRVDGLGVAESEVTTQGSGADATIVVSVPGVSQDRLLELVQRTALLDFRPVWTIAGPAPASLDDTAAPAPAPTADDTATTAQIVQDARRHGIVSQTHALGPLGIDGLAGQHHVQRHRRTDALRQAIAVTKAAGQVQGLRF